MGAMCYRMVAAGRIDRLDTVGLLLYLAQIALGIGAGSLAMRIGTRAYEHAEF